jgi:hypothetical protein
VNARREVVRRDVRRVTNEERQRLTALDERPCIVCQHGSTFITRTQYNAVLVYRLVLLLLLLLLLLLPRRR